VAPNAKGVLLTVERGDISDTLPAHLKGIVKLNGNRSYLIDVPVKRAAAAVNASGTSSLGFTLAILLALTGGLVLNLMPCVFPVLFLKALSLAAARPRIAGLKDCMASPIQREFWFRSGQSSRSSSSCAQEEGRLDGAFSYSPPSL
jgi:hypothetical protein